MNQLRLSLSRASLLAAYLFQWSSAAEPTLGQLIFQDDFNRNESQETKDEIGNGWTTSSDRRASGNKQVDLKGGAMFIVMHPTADHAVSVAHDAGFRDGTVEMRFMLENDDDVLGLDFADLQFKDVHAGHLFKVEVDLKKVLINDTKTGSMNLKIRDQRVANTLTLEQQKILSAKKKTFPVKLHTKSWYTLSVHTVGDSVSVAIDGKPVGSFTSEGFAHPTKRIIRLSVPRQAVIDDVKIFSEN